MRVLSVVLETAGVLQRAFPARADRLVLPQMCPEEWHQGAAVHSGKE